MSSDPLSIIYYGRDQDTFSKCVQMIEQESKFRACVTSMAKLLYTDVTFSFHGLKDIFEFEVSELLKKRGVKENEYFFVKLSEERAAFQKGVLCGFQAKNRENN